MELQTALVLAIQLLALFSIAGALLLYLLCKVRATRANPTENRNGTTILVTSADTAFGLQLCTHLASRGCRVFAGLKNPEESITGKLIRGWIKMRENSDCPLHGSIVPLQLDVTREDILREATEAMGAYMNAGERGIAAVVNTAGSLYRGRVETQDIQQWEMMLKTNILGSLRVAKSFTGLLRPTRGRLIYLGAGDKGDGLVAFTASRVAVETCADELRKELQPYGIEVIALDTNGIASESLFKAPTPFNLGETHEGMPIQYTADVLTPASLQVIEHALWDIRPQIRYQLVPPQSKVSFMLPCRSSFRFKMNLENAQTV